MERLTMAKIMILYTDAIAEIDSLAFVNKKSLPEQLVFLYSNAVNIITRFSHSYDEIKKTHEIPSDINDEIIKFINDIQQNIPSIDVNSVEIYNNFFHSFLGKLVELQRLIETSYGVNIP